MSARTRLAALSIACGAMLATTAATPEGTLHFALDRSAPEADATVPSPSEIRLWFTEEPQEGTTAIRLIDAEGAAVHVGEIVQDEEDPTSFAVAVHGALAPGSYTVSWRGMGADGHAVRESFRFSVVADR